MGGGWTCSRERHIQLRSFVTNNGQYSFHAAWFVKARYIFVGKNIVHKHPEETCILSNERHLSACTLAQCRNGKIAIVTESIRTRAETVHTKASRHSISTFLYITVGSFVYLTQV